MRPPRPAAFEYAQNNIKDANTECVETSVIVEFRPLHKWRGEFGFDWLRVTEAEANPIEGSYIRDANVLENEPFQEDSTRYGLIQSGYKGLAENPTMTNSLVQNTYYFKQLAHQYLFSTSNLLDINTDDFEENKRVFDQLDPDLFRYLKQIVSDDQLKSIDTVILSTIIELAENIPIDEMKNNLSSLKDKNMKYLDGTFRLSDDLIISFGEGYNISIGNIMLYEHEIKVSCDIIHLQQNTEYNFNNLLFEYNKVFFATIKYAINQINWISNYLLGDSELSPDEAQSKIKNEYEQLPISGQGREGKNRHLTYYVPLLNLYPQNSILKNSDLPNNIKEYSIATKLPPHPVTAELRMLIDIKSSNINNLESIIIVADNEIFDINFNDSSSVKKRSENKTPNFFDLLPQDLSTYIEIPLINHTPTPDNQCTSRKAVTKSQQELILTITCKQVISSDTFVYVYSIVNRKPVISGKIRILKNTETKQKELKFVFVKVKTDIHALLPALTGNYFESEIVALHHTLHQALIHPRIITQYKGNDIILDILGENRLELESMYKMFNKIKGGGATQQKIYETLNHQYPDLAKKEYFPIFFFKNFIFAIGHIFGNFKDNSEFQQSANMCLCHFLNPYPLSHEVLHGLNLRHTHRDSIPVDNPNQKYIFPSSKWVWDIPNKGILNRGNMTTNVMSYNPFNTYSTWHWQWQIMQETLEEKIKIEDVRVNDDTELPKKGMLLEDTRVNSDEELSS